MASVTLLEARDLSRSFQDFVAVAHADLEVGAGEIVGLIGPNGAGKSTLFNCLSGDLVPSGGSVRFDGADVTGRAPEERARLGLGRTYQVPATFEHMTVLENVMVGAFLRYPRRANAEAAAERVLAFTGLAPHARARAGTLGTPGRKRLEIARALATGPRVLLLDEALAGLTPAEIYQAVELVRQIHRQGIALLVVEHIMEVIMSLAHRVVVLNHGRIIAAGAPHDVVADPAVIEAYLGRRAAARRPAGRP